jgi:hypothetical protein
MFGIGCMQLNKEKFKEILNVENITEDEKYITHSRG